MRLVGKIIFVFTALCSYWSAEVWSLDFRKEWKFHGDVMFKYGRNIAVDDNSFLFAVCPNKTQLPEMTCNVTIETPISTWQAKPSRKSTCQLKLSRTDSADEHEITRIVSVERFAGDRVIVVWWEGLRFSQMQLVNMKVSILRMANCQATHLTFPLDFEHPTLLSNVVIYSNSFDVISSNRHICNASACRINHDLDGRPTGKPIPFASSISHAYVQPVMRNSPNKGFYSSGSDLVGWKFRAMHVGRTGSGKNLMKVSVSDPTEVCHATSNSQEMFGICLLAVKKIHCAQFDEKAKARMNATLSNVGSVNWMAVHNLPEGGILLLTGLCKNSKCRSFRITKVKLDGSYDVLMNANGLRLRCTEVPQKFSVSIAESASDYCFYFACSYVPETDEDNSKHSIKFGSNCIPKANLTL